MNTSQTAVRAEVRGRVQGVGFRDAAVARARELGALGWVRNAEDGSVLVHAEGEDGGRGAGRLPPRGPARGAGSTRSRSRR